MHHLDQAGLEYLAQRLRDGEGPDRALDLSIDRAFIRDDDHDKLLNKAPDRALHYTSSIDAALNLGRRNAGVNLPEIHDYVIQKIPSGIIGTAFIPIFARAFCLQVIETLKSQQSKLSAQTALTFTPKP